MAGVVADTGNSDGSQLPGVVIIDFGDTDAELVLNTGDDRFYDLPFALERLIFRQAEFYFTDTYVHDIKRAISNQLSAIGFDYLYQYTLLRNGVHECR